MLKVLDVDGAVRRVTSGWEATGQPWPYDAERYARVAAVRQSEQQAMRDYIATTRCRMQFLREQLDDPYAAPCGRCDNCGGTTIPAGASAVAVTAARARLGRPGVTIEPRRQWPTAMTTLGVPLSGRIPADQMATPGRAIARFTDLGYGSRMRELFAPDHADEDVPDDLFQAAIKVLAAWGWDARPAAVISIGSRTRPRLVESLASRLARIGRLPYLGSVAHAGAPNERRANSAQRLRAVCGTYTVPSTIRAALPGLAGKPILLVDDWADTGWTITVVTCLLREVGAGPVYPFVLALQA